MLGPGSLATAHTDYWHDPKMLGDIFEPVPPPEGTEVAPSDLPKGAEKAPPRQPAARPHVDGLTVFALLAVLAILASAWVGLVWWEENIKANDTERVVILDRGHFQFVLWLALAALIGTHALSWSASTRVRTLCVGGALILAGVLYAALPPLRFLGEPAESLSVKGGAATDEEFLFFPV
ncbi:MAG: hypothetical protein J0I06_03475 [Planctomycetes bacterium]|nr:hypothetical protein [Planctomycetota bacterium]